MSALTEFIEKDLADAGDTSEETPAPAVPETPPAEEPAADTAPEESATGEEAIFDPAILKERPELQPYAKQLQADYTRKMQALAEQRRALEGIDPSSIEWVRAYNSALMNNPTAARQMLAEAQAQLDGPSAPAPGPTEIDDPWVTDTERQLAQRLERLEQEHTLAANTALVRQQLDALEKEIGVSISSDDRLALYTEMTLEGIPLRHARTHWLGRHGVEHIRRLAREEGARNVVAKQGMAPAPSGLATREVETTKVAGSLIEQLRMDQEAGWGA